MTNDYCRQEGDKTSKELVKTQVVHLFLRSVPSLPEPSVNQKKKKSREELKLSILIFLEDTLMGISEIASNVNVGLTTPQWNIMNHRKVKNKW